MKPLRITIVLFAVAALSISIIFVGISSVPNHTAWAQNDADRRYVASGQFPACLNVGYVPPCVDEDDQSMVFSCNDPRNLEVENQCTSNFSSEQTSTFGGNMSGLGEFPPAGGNVTDEFGFGGNVTDEFGGNMSGLGEFPPAGGNVTDEFGGNMTGLGEFPPAGGNVTDEFGFGGNVTDEFGFGGNVTDEFGGNMSGNFTGNMTGMPESQKAVG